MNNMLQKIKTVLGKPLSNKTIVATATIIIVACLIMAGILYWRYEFEISRESPVFTPPTPFELLQSKTANNAAWIEELGKNLNNLNKEVEEVKKNQEAQDELSKSFLFIDPTTNDKIYVNREYGFQIGVPDGWYYLGSLYTAEQEITRRRRDKPGESIKVSSVSFSSEQVENPLYLSQNELYFSISVYEHPEDGDLIGWINNFERDNSIISENDTRIADQKTLLRIFDSSVSPVMGDTGYGMKSYLKSGKVYLIFSIEGADKESWRASEGEFLFKKILNNIKFIY